MLKVKKFRRRAEDDEAEVDDVEKPVVKSVLEKTAKEKFKEKPLPKIAGPKLLSFAEDEEDGGRKDIKRASATGKLGSKKEKAKGTKASGASLLSFEGEVENTADNAQRGKKKSGFGSGHGTGHRLGPGRDKSAGTLPIPSNVQAQTGEYTKEKLLELQRQTIRLGAPKQPAETKPAEPVVVLKGLVKPPGVPNGSHASVIENLNNFADTRTFDGRDWVDMGRDDRDRLRRDKDDAESRLGLMGIGAGAESGGITHIPDAAAIAAAKAKRERLRQAQAAPDYISLAPGDGVELRAKLRESGLVQEQDDDLDKEEVESSEDEGEVRGRLAFLGGKTSGAMKRSGVFESVDEKVIEGKTTELRDEDEEDEERRWEEEQLRKGVGKRVDDASNWIGAPTAGAPQNHISGPAPAGVPAGGAGSVGWGFSRSMEGLSVSQQAESAMRTLQESLQRLRETHARTQSELYRTEENLSSSVNAVEALEKNLTAAGEKYIYMQELRDYIAVLCEFLNDKAPLIEELEEHMQRLHEERANALFERREGDNADEMAEVEAAVSVAKAVISKGAGVAAAASAAAAVSAREGANLAPQLDEFGRDINLQKRLESKRRAQARERRMAQIMAKRISSMASGNGDGNASQHVEGESSSDESESEERAYTSRREEVLETAGSLFGDAAEEFAQLAKVKVKLEGWKWKYFPAYRDAYVSLSASAIFAPFVRLELLRWDPLYADSGFSNMEWYRLLFEYGIPPNGIEMESHDADGDLIPKLIEKVALPVLHHELAHCWDQMSTVGTRRAVAAVQNILLHVPASSEALKELLAAVHIRMAASVAGLEVPTWTLQVIGAVPQAACFSAQKFGNSVRLLRNLGMWKDVLGLPVLEQLALDELLSGKILPHLRTLLATLHDAVTRTERVVAALSGVWVGPKFSELSPKLSSFVEYMTTLTRALEKKREGGANSEDTVGLARRVKRMLVELNEYDRARRLSRNFQLKEAL